MKKIGKMTHLVGTCGPPGIMFRETESADQQLDTLLTKHNISKEMLPEALSQLGDGIRNRIITLYFHSAYMRPEFIDYLEQTGYLAENLTSIRVSIFGQPDPVIVTKCMSRILDYHPGCVGIHETYEISLLARACYYRPVNLGLVSLILDKGADPNEEFLGRTAMTFAESELISHFLIQRGAAIDTSKGRFATSANLIQVAYLRLSGYEPLPRESCRCPEHSHWHTKWECRGVWNTARTLIEYPRIGGAEGVRYYIFFKLSLLDSLLYLLTNPTTSKDAGADVARFCRVV